MKILFVVKDIDYIDPIGLMTISALAKSRGNACHLGIIARHDILKEMLRLRPDIVAYSASTGEHKYYLRLNEMIKSIYKDEVFTIMGGTHPTLYSDCLNGSTLDAICVGEGDFAFLELLDALKGGCGPNGIKNIVARNGPNNGLRELNEDLDSLPFPDRALFYETTEMAHFPLKSFITSRGCPYFCTYCFNHAFRKLYQDNGGGIRRHSVDYIIDQIIAVKARYSLEFVKFYDDIFVYSADAWFEEFAMKYKKSVSLPFHCLTRADLLTEDVARLLKWAGCHSVSISIEAGNSYLRDHLLKRNMGDAQILEAFRLCRKYDIKTFSNNIVGLPFARIEDEVATLDLNLRCSVSFAEFPIFHPYPGTELGDFAIERGIYNVRYEAMHMSYMNKSPLRCFSEREKNIQRNLSRLGVVVVLFPILRNIVVKYLIYLPYNIFFFLSYYFAKAYMVHKRIYPFKMGMVARVSFFRKSLKLEHFKLTDESMLLLKTVRGV